MRQQVLAAELVLRLPCTARHSTMSSLALQIAPCCCHYSNMTPSATYTDDQVWQIINQLESTFASDSPLAQLLCQPAQRIINEAVPLRSKRGACRRAKQALRLLLWLLRRKRAVRLRYLQTQQGPG